MGKDKKKKGKGKEKTTDLPLVVRSAIEVAYNDEADPNSVLRGALEAIGVDELAAAVGYSNPGDIQPMLDENAATIGAIVEYRGMGREDEAAQRMLHRNLTHLTSLTNLMHLASNTDEEEEEEEEEEKEVDFGALKSLSDDGIDMSFLDALKDKYYEVQ